MEAIFLIACITGAVVVCATYSGRTAIGSEVGRTEPPSGSTVTATRSAEPSRFAVTTVELLKVPREVASPVAKVQT